MGCQEKRRQFPTAREPPTNARRRKTPIDQKSLKDAPVWRRREEEEEEEDEEEEEAQDGGNDARKERGESWKKVILGVLSMTVCHMYDEEAEVLAFWACKMRNGQECIGWN